jgi:hypothetical protein
MRIAFPAFAAALAWLIPGGPAAAQEKPAKYEYAELRFARTFGGPGGFGGGPPGAFPGGPVPGLPGPAGVAPGGPPGFAAHTTVRWTTGEEELTFKDWEELADKLKAPSAKKDSPPTVHKLRVLNKLSADGWEVLDRPAADAASGTWTFRRRVP